MQTHPTAEKLDRLRRLMAQNGLSAWIVPSTDPHQSEYVAEAWKARAWLSGFKGSAGTLVVTRDRAGLWTDPRYHLRAQAELAGSGIELFRMGLPGTPALADWLKQELPAGALVGFDGETMSASEASVLRAGLAEKEIAISGRLDLVGAIWDDRPALPSNPVFLLPDSFAGESRASKLSRIRAVMRTLGLQYHLLCALDDIAWTLNLRGSDIQYNPLALCYALISLQDAHLFIHPGKVSGEVETDLARDGVALHPYGDVPAFLQRLPGGSRLLVDPEKTSLSLLGSIPPGCQVTQGQSLPFGLKAIKNPLELEGIRRMHRRDGAALVRWFCWLEQHVAEGGLTEISAADRLAEFRSQGEYYQGLSFGTIAGYGPNSAVGHYQSDPLTVPTLHPRGIFLVDSGAQYLDGTSDITRTVSLGNPTAQERQAFTTVLKCHIRLATARFPRGAKGIQLDAIAREPLWRLGWNCRHGIGHGVGCFLNVHEGPQRFSETNLVPLEAGMLLSNEPGVYFEGQFGVRIENVLVALPDGKTDFGEYLRFETLSLCPIDLDLVEPGLLERDEIAWLNAYHRQVRDALAPWLSAQEQAWLWRETREL